MKTGLNWKVAEAIMEHFVDGGLYFTRNICGDEMETVYCKDGVMIDVCGNWGYFEVFGLREDEQKIVSDFYYSLKTAYRKFDRDVDELIDTESLSDKAKRELEEEREEIAE